MSDLIKIAVDAMGGENSPKKIIDGIEISLKTNQDNFFYLYGKKNLLESLTKECVLALHKNNLLSQLIKAQLIKNTLNQIVFDELTAKNAFNSISPGSV